MATRAQLITLIRDLIPDNDTQQVSPLDVRTPLEALVAEIFPYVPPVISISSNVTIVGWEMPLAATINVSVSAGDTVPAALELRNVSNTIVASNSTGAPISYTEGAASDVSRAFEANYYWDGGAEYDYNNVTITAVPPVFYGVYATPGLTDPTTIKEELTSLALTKTLLGGRELNFNADGERLYIVYPDSFGAPASILDPDNSNVKNSFSFVTVTITFTGGRSALYRVYYNDQPFSGTNFKLRVNF